MTPKGHDDRSDNTGTVNVSTDTVKEGGKGGGHMWSNVSSELSHHSIR